MMKLWFALASAFLLTGCVYGTAEEETINDAQIKLNEELRNAQMTARLLWRGSSVLIEAFVNYPHNIDYCRFMSMSGPSFTMDTLPNGYTKYSSTATECAVLIVNPTSMDLHSWTVAIKLEGQDGEIFGSTGHAGSPPPQAENNNTTAGDVFFWLFIAILCLLPVIGGAVFVSKRYKNCKCKCPRDNTVTDSYGNTWNNQMPQKPVGITEEQQKA